MWTRWRSSLPMQRPMKSRSSGAETAPNSSESLTMRPCEEQNSVKLGTSGTAWLPESNPFHNRDTLGKKKVPGTATRARCRDGAGPPVCPPGPGPPGTHSTLAGRLKENHIAVNDYNRKKKPIRFRRSNRVNERRARWNFGTRLALKTRSRRHLSVEAPTT